MYLIFQNLEKLRLVYNKPAVVANNFVGDVYKQSSCSECSARIIIINFTTYLRAKFKAKKLKSLKLIYLLHGESHSRLPPPLSLSVSR